MKEWSIEALNFNIKIKLTKIIKNSLQQNIQY